MTTKQETMGKGNTPPQEYLPAMRSQAMYWGLRVNQVCKAVICSLLQAGLLGTLQALCTIKPPNFPTAFLVLNRAVSIPSA